jgi:hypothetical protein
MTDYSNEYKLSGQTEAGKKEWKKAVNSAATAVAECIKQKSFQLGEVIRNHYLYAMQKTYKIYYSRNLEGLGSKRQKH